MTAKKFILSAASLTALAGVGSAEVLDTIGEFGDAATGNALSGAGIARGFTNPAAGDYTITAGGHDLWGTTDHGSFIYDLDTVQSGDFSAVVRIDNIGEVGESLPGEWGRTGLLARAGTANVAQAADAANVGAIKKWGTDGTKNFALSHQWRDSAGGNTGRTEQAFGPQPGGTQGAGVSTWVSLHRQGGQWWASWANDVAGSPGTWTVPTTHAVNANHGGDVHVGIAHQNHNVQPQTSTATFSNFSVTAPDESTLGGGNTVASLDGKAAGTLNAGDSVTGNSAVLGWFTNAPVGGADYVAVKVSGATPGLQSDMYLSGNPGNLAGHKNIINNVAPVVSTVLPNVNWANPAGAATAGINGYPAAWADAGGAGNFNPGNESIAGGNNNGQNNYSVHVYGEIFIPADADRLGADNNIVNFKDGIDDYTYLNIDGETLIDDNAWAGPNGVQGGNPTGSPIAALDVSGAKYDDGEWVSFDFIMGEGGGGDAGIIGWDATDANANFPTAITDALNPEDIIDGQYFRYFASIDDVSSGTGAATDFGLTLENGDHIALLVDGLLVGSRDVIPEPSAAILSLLGFAFFFRRRR